MLTIKEFFSQSYTWNTDVFKGFDCRFSAVCNVMLCFLLQYYFLPKWKKISPHICSYLKSLTIDWLEWWFPKWFDNVCCDSWNLWLSLFGKMIFEVGWLNPMISIFYKRKAVKDLRQRWKHCDKGRCSHKSRNANSHHKLEEIKDMLSQSLQRVWPC